MNALRRGVKNTFRNAIRSVGVILILAVAIALAISMLIARDAVTKKIDSVRASTGNTISVSPKGFFGGQGGGTPLTQAQLAQVSSIPHVTSVQESLSQRLTTSETSLVSSITPGSLGQQFGGGGGGGGGFSATFTLPVRVTGTTTPGNALVGGANGGGTETLTKGTTFSPTSSANVAILGTSLASANNLTVGSTFTAWTTKITVVGIYNAGSTFANAGVLMPLKTVQTLAALPGEITSATVVVDSVDNVAQVTNEINAKIGSSADVVSTQQTVEAQLAPLNSVKTISTYTLIGAVVAAGIILLLSMLMIVRERRREIGVLKAIGAPNRSVIAQFVAEATTFTVIGSIVGLAFGILLSNPITSVLVSSNTSSPSSEGAGFVRGGGPPSGGGPPVGGGPPSGGGGFRFSGLHNTLTQVHTAASWSTLVFAFLIAILVATIGSTIAVANIVRIRPAEVLRSE